ncbi:MAG: alkaline phosphatase family protein [Deltaproteobacteria bacterium]
MYVGPRSRFPLLAAAAAAAVTMVACSTPASPDVVDVSNDLASDTDADAMDASVDTTTAPDVSPDYLRPPDVTRTSVDSVLAARRTACEFGPGAWAAETLGTDVPIGAEIPIDHVLVLMMENRSFDEYFAHLPEAGQTDVEVPPAGWSNPRADGSPVAPFLDTTYCHNDLDHGWDGTHHEWNNGAMDGFVTANDPMGERAMAYMTQAQLPFYYGLATTFAVADHYYSSLLGPTFPNRIFMFAATSFGLTFNIPLVQDTAAHPVNQIFARLDAAGLDWRDYAGSLRSTSVFLYYSLARRQTAPHMASIEQLMTDLSTGNIPPFSFIEPTYSGTGATRADEHPPGAPQTGEAWVEPIVRAVMSSPAWARTALFITYDEHGGFADHVAPPPACAPDGNEPVARNPDGGTPIPAAGRFDRYGVRVPLIVVSPWARAHHVSHATFDHTSILRFVEARFGLPAMTRRDANATPVTDLFDFSHPTFMVPPAGIAHAPGLSSADSARCMTAFPTSTGL